LGKVDVVKAWKPEMNALGFVYRGNMFQIAIRERKHLIDVLEPLSSEQREAIARVWPRPADSDWRVPPMTFYCASILHYLAGDREMAILRTKDWLARLDPDNINEREQAQTQLNLLVRIH